MPKTPLVEFENVTTVFRGRGASKKIVAVDSASFTMPSEKPSILTLVGESGSGKSTMARNLLALTPHTSGTIRYQGRDIQTLTPEEKRDFRLNVQPVFQDPYATYNPFYRIDRVLHAPIRRFKLAKTKQEAQDKVEEALTAVDLRPGDILGRYPHQLSGGERQRIMLARIYLIRPRLIIADEPVSMIDASLRILFLNILLDFRDKYGISCIHITHNLATAYYLGGELIILCRGRVVEYGDMDKIIAEPHHPYTQLLVHSVPNPDPKQRGQSQEHRTEAIDTSEIPVEAHQCVFAARCPQVMSVCEQKRPTMIEVAPTQKTACFLYADDDILSVSDSKLQRSP